MTELVQIARLDLGRLGDLASISIGFEARSRVDLGVLQSTGGLEIAETPFQPRFKDYDAAESERPNHLSLRYDLGNWACFGAARSGTVIGGILVCPPATPYVIHPGLTDTAIIVDLRVAPECRGTGVGRQLVEAAIQWSSDQGATGLAAETQDINVAACRFYSACGFKLYSIDQDAYPPEMDEAQIIWRLPLSPR